MSPPGTWTQKPLGELWKSSIRFTRTGPPWSWQPTITKSSILCGVESLNSRPARSSAMKPKVAIIPPTIPRSFSLDLERPRRNRAVRVHPVGSVLRHSAEPVHGHFCGSGDVYFSDVRWLGRSVTDADQPDERLLVRPGRGGNLLMQ